MEPAIDMTPGLSFERKVAHLEEITRDLGSALVALSGGVDSAVLLKATHAVIPDRMAAATADSVLSPPGELDTAVKIAGQLGVRHIIFKFDPLILEQVRANSPRRCYHCKMSLGTHLLDLASALGFAWVVEGSQMDDAQTHRPGREALRELGIRSPLQEAGFSKEEVRRLAKSLDLINWDRPSSACLATRFPYDSTLTVQALEQVFQAEQFLAQEGLAGGRARHHGDVVRLELPQKAMELLSNEGLRSRLTEGLHRLGFSFVTLDLAGYRSGAFDAPPGSGSHASGD